MIVRILASAKKSYYHKIKGKVHPNSFAGYLCLKAQYQKQDRQCILWRMGHRVWLNFRNKILREIKRANNGCLTCSYCGSENLVMNINIKGLPKRKQATLDHVIPRSKGGSEYSLDNLVVACFHCNQKKKDDIVK